MSGVSSHDINKQVREFMDTNYWGLGLLHGFAKGKTLDPSSESPEVISEYNRQFFGWTPDDFKKLIERIEVARSGKETLGGIRKSLKLAPDASIQDMKNGLDLLQRAIDELED